VVKLDLAAFGGSALTDTSIAVPVDGIEPGIPVTYVPARNTILLSLALAWAETLGCFDLFAGMNAIDYSGYPDCRPEFLRAFEQTANFARDQGLSVTEAGLAGKGTPEVIVCANDDMALGAMEACKARGLKDVKIYGFDALPEALKAVKDGTMRSTIEQFPGEQSRTAMRIAVAFARDGKKPDSAVTLLTPIAITTANFDKAERVGEM
jgi:hypothetical protein